MALATVIARAALATVNATTPKTQLSTYHIGPKIFTNMNQNRKAFTLVELLTVVTVGSSLMLLAVSLVHRTMQLSQAAKEKSERMQSLNRFADQLRRDVHAAESVEVESMDRVTIRLADHNHDDSHALNARDTKTTIVYAVTEHIIARELTTIEQALPNRASLGKAEIADQPLRDPLQTGEPSRGSREQVQLGERSSAKFELIAQPPRVALTVLTELEQLDGSPPRIDRRLEIAMPPVVNGATNASDL